jgi:hypothetical protein
VYGKYSRARSINGSTVISVENWRWYSWARGSTTVYLYEAAADDACSAEKVKNPAPSDQWPPSLLRIRPPIGNAWSSFRSAPSCVCWTGCDLSESSRAVS